MTHTHRDEGQACSFKTMKACDENWTQFSHGHIGRPCIKAIQESKTKKGQANKIATCTITAYPEKGMSFMGFLRWQKERVNAS